MQFSQKGLKIEKTAKQQAYKTRYILIIFILRPSTSDTQELLAQSIHFYQTGASKRISSAMGSSEPAFPFGRGAAEKVKNRELRE